MRKKVIPEEPVEDDDPTVLPSQLVDAVLSLEPMQRASLAAVIAGSLASELLDARASKPKRR